MDLCERTLDARVQHTARIKGTIHNAVPISVQSRDAPGAARSIESTAPTSALVPVDAMTL